MYNDSTDVKFGKKVGASVFYMSQPSSEDILVRQPLSGSRRWSQYIPCLGGRRRRQRAAQRQRRGPAPDPLGQRGGTAALAIGRARDAAAAAVGVLGRDGRQRSAGLGELDRALGLEAEALRSADAAAAAAAAHDERALLLAEHLRRHFLSKMLSSFPLPDFSTDALQRLMPWKR